MNCSFSTNSTDKQQHYTRKNQSQRARFTKNQSGKFIDKKNVLKIESEIITFKNASDNFEYALRKLNEIDDQQVYERLIQIKDLIENKILTFQCKDNNDNVSELSDLELGEMGSSQLNLDSDSSDMSYITFSREVMCPFCLKTQDDKIKLIEHLDHCQSIKTKMFDKKTFLPFSTFQILPNNYLKCNICPNSVLKNVKAYFKHLENLNHNQLLNKAAAKKKFSELLFCSCCKVQVPNNFTQITFHIKHEIHKARSNCIPISEALKLKVNLIYLISKKFNCLICSNLRASFQSAEELLVHLGSPSHKQRANKNTLKCEIIYCQFCLKEVNFSEIFIHLSQNSHKKKEKASEKFFELCFYCGLVCDNLEDLSIHMEKNCTSINNIRKKQLKNEPKILNTNLLYGSEIINKSKTENNESPLQPNSIIVKGDFEITELAKLLKNFGEITALNMCNKKGIIVTFKEKSSVTEILSLQNVIEINGKKLELILAETLGYTSEVANEADAFDQSINVPDLEVSDSKKALDSDSSDEHNYHHYIDDLFERATSSLMKTTKKLDSDIKKRIVQDCKDTFLCQECSIVGFAACGLSFTAESINLFCDMSNKMNVNLNDSNSAMIYLFDFNKCLMQKSISKMITSDFWEDVVFFMQPFPHYHCRHIKSQLICKVTFMHYTNFLTNILSHCLGENSICLGENSIIRGFCLLAKFWFNIQNLRIKDYEYLLISLFVFFLISKNLVKPFTAVNTLPSHILKFHNAIIEQIKSSEPTEDVTHVVSNIRELFQKFLGFLRDFDFQNFAICLPVKFPVPKFYFLEDRFINYLGAIDPNELIKSPICVLDPFLSVNLASNITEEVLKSLLENMEKIGINN